MAIVVQPLLGNPPAHAEDTVLRSFSGGSGPTAVGITSADDAEDKEEDAPQALTADQTGNLLMLDQVNGRILKFDPANPSAEPQVLELPQGVAPTDLVVQGDTIYVWDGKIHALEPLGQPAGPTRGLTETRGIADEATVDAFAQMGTGVDLGDASPTRGFVADEKVNIARRQTVNTRGKGPVVVGVTVTEGGAGAKLEVRQKGQAAPIAKFGMSVQNKLGTVAFLEIDRHGRLFVLGENIPVSIGDQALAFVARYAPNGVLEGIYELPLAQTTILSRRFVTISPDGDVYFLKSKRNQVDVVGLGFRTIAKGEIIDVVKTQPNYAAMAWAGAKGVSMAVGPLSRQKVLQTAYGFENLQWTVAASNYGNDEQCTGFAGRLRRPMYMIGKEGEPVKGVPYCWGCQGSLNQFATNVTRGAMAGNVCTRENPRPDVVGVDCSSFVSAAWGLSTHFSTAAIPAITTQLTNPWDMLPGDAFDKPGSHVMLFLGFTPDRQAQVMEASPGACQGRVCRNVYPLSSLLARGYLPVRFRGLETAQQ